MPKINDLEVDDYLHDSISIVPEALQEEMCRISTDLAYWGERYADALRAYKVAKLHREQVVAKLHLEKKEFMAAEGKKPTVGDLEAAVSLDPKVEAAKLAEIEAEAAYASLRNRFSAVSAKKDMLQSIGAQMRAEMGYDPSARMVAQASREDF